MWTRFWPRPPGRSQRCPFAANRQRIGIEISFGRRADARLGFSGTDRRQHHRPLEGPGRPAHVPFGSAAGGPHPLTERRRGNAGLHLPDAARRACVVRLFGGAGRYQHLDDLGLPEDVLQPLRVLLSETSGAILVSGPAGSGKTTTVYACLREIANKALEHEASSPSRTRSKSPSTAWSSRTSTRRPVWTWPVDCVFSCDKTRSHHGWRNSRQCHSRHGAAGVADRSSLAHHFPRRQCCRNNRPAVGYGHRAVRAAQRTAGHPQSAIAKAFVLVRNAEQQTRDDRLGLDVEKVMTPCGCDKCGGTGYRGRFLLVEMLTLSRSELARAILAHSETATIERLAAEAGMVGRRQRACRAVNEGSTSPAEVRRVLGFSGN